MSRPSEVAVNLLWASPGRVGGSEDYLARQLVGLGDLDDESLRVTLYCGPAFAEAHPELTDRFDVVRAPLRRDARPLRIALEHSWLAMRARDADLVHHGGGTAPTWGPHPRIVTVHDLQYRRFPDYFSRARRTYLSSTMPRSVRSAAIVATPTEYVRSTVIEAFGVDPSRVRVVPHGVPDQARPSDAEIADTRERFGLGARPFVVYPAITHPHKGHRLLVDMLDHLDTPADVAVVLLGGEGSAEESLRAAIAASAHAARFVRPGRVDAVARDALVAGAEALVFPSEYEGFGAPLIEAMTLGTPVVASAADGVREVAGDAAVVVGDATGAAWAAGVAEAIRRRSALIELGRRRREAFTLSVSGRALADAYRAAFEPAPAAG